MNEVNNINRKNIDNDINIKVRKKKKIILFSLIGFVGVVLIGFLIFQILFPKIYLSNFKNRYTIKEFSEVKKKVKSTLFVPKDKTIWNLNGYDFYQGKETTSMPIVIGKNELVITNGKLSKKYIFEINLNDDSSPILTDENYLVSSDYLDYDGDGISNEVEKEKGLSTYTNDTDSDGLLDNVELVMNLDPRVKDNYDIARNYKVYQDDSKKTKNYLMIKGKGNVANTFLDTSELNVGFPNKFIQSDVLSLVTSNNETPDSMTIYFDKSYSWNLDNYSIYQYNKTTGDLIELRTSNNDEYFYADTNMFDCFYFVGNKQNAPTGEYKNQIMILIDNSGSMFTKEYVAAKNNTNLDKVATEDYGHDVNFKRLSLMSSLVERLGTDKYQYSVYAFTHSYCDIISGSKDKDAIIKGINSLKTECQEFNGTDMSGAVRKYSSKFDTTSYGKKYMIVLTDGIDTGLFNYKLYDHTLNNYAKQGINIITIGLSEFTDSEYLMKIASKTNGKYLYASDANMLDTLIEIIESSIEGQSIEEIDGKEVTLIADSGFKVNRDGFSFDNFGSDTSEGGNCYGFSLMSKQIYLNQFKTSDEFVDGGQFGTDLIAYTLTDVNKKRLVKGNVYNIKLNNNYNTLFNLDPSSDDYRYLGDDGIPYLSDKYKKLADGSGFNPYIKDLGSESTELNVGGKTGNYSKYESLGVINLTDDSNIKDENKDDYQVLQLINRSWAVQTHSLTTAIGKYVEKQMQGEHYDYELQVKKMIKELQIGAPAMLSITTSVGSHSVLATKVYRTNDLEKYIIGIYDNNVSGEESKMYLERQVSYNLFSETSYYSLKYENYGYSFYQMLYEE